MNLNKLDAVEKLINSENCIDIDYVDADGSWWECEPPE
jgi:hypothetical protein